jgi:hypothetical protein
VTRVEVLDATRVDDVVARIAARQRDVALAQPMIAADVDVDVMRASLLDGSACSIALSSDDVAGHLRGAVLDSDVYGRSAWIGPGDVSYDAADVLDALYV